MKIVAVFDHMRSDSEPRVDTVGIYVENHYNECRELFIWIPFGNGKLGEKGCPPLLLEDLLICKLCPLEESASHHVVITFSTPENNRNPPKSSKINDLENEPGHVWRRPKVSGVTRDDI